MGNCSASPPPGPILGTFDLNTSINQASAPCQSLCQDINFSYTYYTPGWYELLATQAVASGSTGMVFTFTSSDPSYPCVASVPTPGSYYFNLQGGTYSFPFTGYALNNVSTTYMWSGVMTFIQTPNPAVG